MFPVHVPLASALLGTLLPERGVVGDHGRHEVVGGLLPRRGPAQGVRVQVARVAVVLQHRHYGVLTDWPGRILGKRTDVDM